MNKNYWLLWSGFSISTLGTYLSLIVINLFIYQLTGSPFLVGVFLLLRLAPALFMGNIAGVLADKFDRRYIMIIADITRAILISSLILLREKFFPLYFVIFFISICDRLYQSAMGGGLPNIVGMQNITKANAYLTSGRTVALVVGPMLGGLLISSGFYGFAFGIDATTYLFSAIMVWLITAEFHEKFTARQKVNFWGGLKQGYGFLFARMGLFSIILLRCLDAFGSSSLNVGLPVFASGLGQFTPGICYGFMMLAYGIGEMTGAIFLAKSRLVRESHPEIVIGVTILFMAVSFGISMNVTNIFLGMFFIFFCGTFEGATVVTYNTALQKNPDEVRGRIVGFSEAGVWGSMGIGMFLSGLIMEHIDFGVIVQIFSAVIVAGSIFHIIFWRKKLLVNRIKEAADYV